MPLAVQKVRVKSLKKTHLNCTNSGALSKLLLWSYELLRIFSHADRVCHSLNFFLSFFNLFFKLHVELYKWWSPQQTPIWSCELLKCVSREYFPMLIESIYHSLIFLFFFVFKLHLTFQGRTDLFVLGHFKVK